MVLATVNAVHVRKSGCRTKISLKDGMSQMNGDTYPTVNGQIGTLRTSFIWNITPEVLSGLYVLLVSAAAGTACRNP